MQQHDSLADGYRLVAIEPMSGSTDCFNNADGLVVLQAGEVPPPPFQNAPVHPFARPWFIRHVPRQLRECTNRFPLDSSDLQTAAPCVSTA